jgi:hypothetical protein
VPGFIARQFYVAGSLRNTDTGFELQAHNPMGDGVLIGVGQVSVDGRAIDPAAVTAQRPGDDQPMSARDVSQSNPVNFRKGDSVRLHVTGRQLTPGEHNLEVQLTEQSLGELSFSISDSIAS